MQLQFNKRIYHDAVSLVLFYEFLQEYMRTTDACQIGCTYGPSLIHCRYISNVFRMSKHFIIWNTMCLKCKHACHTFILHNLFVAFSMDASSIGNFICAKLLYTQVSFAPNKMDVLGTVIAVHNSQKDIIQDAVSLLFSRR